MQQMQIQGTEIQIKEYQGKRVQMRYLMPCLTRWLMKLQLN